MYVGLKRNYSSPPEQRRPGGAGRQLFVPATSALAVFNVTAAMCGINQPCVSFTWEQACETPGSCESSRNAAVRIQQLAHWWCAVGSV